MTKNLCIGIPGKLQKKLQNIHLKVDIKKETLDSEFTDSCSPKGRCSVEFHDRTRTHE